MDKLRQVKISKFLSKHLRHTPERLGLTLAAGGWVNVDELLSACAAHQFPLTRAELEAVVATSDKQRYLTPFPKLDLTIEVSDAITEI